MSGGRADQRAFLRVPAQLVATLRKLDSFDLESVRRELMSLRDGGGPRTDPRVLVWLERLERKLDLVLAHVTNKPQRATSSEPREVVISGSGMLLPTSEPVAVGEEVLIELAIPGGDAERVRALAQVVGVRGRPGVDGAAAVALAFRLIGEPDRAAIVRFTHEVQRTLNASASKRDER